MALTSIGQQKTPGRPIEQTFGADLGTPSDSQELMLLGHIGATGDSAASGTAAAYTVATINNSGSLAGGKAEAEAKFGVGSELAKMVTAAISANLSAGVSNVPAIKCVGIPSTVTDFGPADEALVAARNTKQEFTVSCYAGTDTTLGGKLKDHAALISGAQRVENNQYGTVGVLAAMAVLDPSTLHKYDTQYIAAHYMRDMAGSGANPYSVAELAAACAARMASGVVPFNPLDDATIGGVTAPANINDYLTVGAGLESESVLNRGWTPLRVKPNGEVALVRTVTTRLTVDADGVTAVGSYYDVQDFQVLYFWRKTLKTRVSQPDFKRRKASAEAADDLLSEMIRLAELFQAQGMFQAVAQLSKQFRVERNASDRHRFDFKTPVNVIPGLHVIAGNIEAGTQFDIISI